jgi:hypothetical protein
MKILNIYVELYKQIILKINETFIIYIIHFYFF